jgi:hypothetical protein
MGHGGVGTQQIVIELANLLDRLFQFLVIVQPAAMAWRSAASSAKLPALANERRR